MTCEQPIAFVAREVDAPVLEVCVNFGVLAGREATPAEIDELARTLLPDLPDLTIVCERRYEFGTHSEAELHQVRIGVPPASLLVADRAVGEMRELVVARAADWARTCAERRHADV